MPTLNKNIGQVYTRFDAPILKEATKLQNVVKPKVNNNGFLRQDELLQKVSQETSSYKYSRPDELISMPKNNPVTNADAGKHLDIYY